MTLLRVFFKLRERNAPAATVTQATQPVGRVKAIITY